VWCLDGDYAVSLVKEGNWRDFFIMADYKIGSFYYVFILKDFTLNLLSDDTRFSLVMLFDTFLSLMYEFYNIFLHKNQRNIRLTRNHFIITCCLLFDFIINLF
jgi:hypothetical protein